MIAHIVLLQPRADLTDDERRAALDMLRHAAADVPEIRRFRLGQRVKHGLPGYEQLMPQDYGVALIIEVDDVPALTRYLKAPAHKALGHLFATATAAALAYDFDMEELAGDSHPPR
jgi:Stress responsive A/B Barrel Domain